MRRQPGGLVPTPSPEAGSPQAELMFHLVSLPLADTPPDPTGVVFERRLEPAMIRDEYEELVYWEQRATECGAPLMPYGEELDEWALAYRANTATRLRAWALERRPRLIAAVRQLKTAELAALLSDATDGLRELVIAAMAPPADASDGDSTNTAQL